MCSLSRYVVIGGFTGMAAATASGSDLVGWLAAVVAVGITVAVGRAFPTRFGPTQCALAPTEPTVDQAAGDEVASTR